MDIHTILAKHSPKKKSEEGEGPTEAEKAHLSASYSEIPDLFFDKILPNYKLSRQEIGLLLLLYRIIWCKPNLHREFGISPLLPYGDLSEALKVSVDELFRGIKGLEKLGLIESVRSGQFFIRKFFTEEFDQLYAQTYDDF